MTRYQRQVDLNYYNIQTHYHCRSEAQPEALLAVRLLLTIY